MILRRITEHVKAQNWTAVALDFVIVVVGVFIGIQVSNWNDARVQKQSARTYIERIRGDLTANQEDLNQRLVYFRQARKSAGDALNALDEPAETLDEKFLIDVYTASHILPRAFGRDTYDEILSVGANNAISDVELRKRLANFYRSVEAPLLNLKGVPPYREMIRRGLPYDVHKIISSACGDNISTGPMGEPIIELKIDCEPDLAQEQISAAVSEILSMNIRKDLVRRVVDLDSKLASIQLVIDRTVLLDEYLQDVD
ncbi:MAG: hypothetical protein DHS20C05_21600 [Hyphococcus sp.]|nr:MAG: hypothetical protein DHS20C05_21600 [Marinicaulis sp.]